MYYIRWWVLYNCYIYYSNSSNLFYTHVVACTLYSVMQSYRNSFCVDVVLDSVNMAFGDEYSLLHQIFEKQIFIDFSISI